MTGRSRFAAGLAIATVGPLVLAPILAPSRGSGTSQVLGILVVVAYAGHVAVTGWLWTVPDVRHTVRTRSVRMVVLPVALVAVAAALALALPDQTLRVLLLGFFAWQFSHFQRQNLGLVKRISSNWSEDPIGKTECRLVVLAGWSGIGALLARPSFLGLSNVVAPTVGTEMVVSLAAAAYATCTFAAVILTLQRRRPAPVAAAYLMSIMFMAPVFLFHSAEAAVTGMVIAHGLQYLWAVRSRSRQARIAEGRTAWQATLGVVAGAILGGAALEAMSELHSAQPGGLRLLYGVYLGVVMAHFAVDGVLWRRPVQHPVTSHRRWTLLPSPGHGRL